MRGKGLGRHGWLEIGGGEAIGGRREKGEGARSMVRVRGSRGGVGVRVSRGRREEERRRKNEKKRKEKKRKKKRKRKKKKKKNDFFLF